MNAQQLLLKSKSYKRTGLLFLLFFVIKISFAADLMEIYRESLQTDPKFLEAYNQFRAQAQSIGAASPALQAPPPEEAQARPVLISNPAPRPAGRGRPGPGTL